MIRAIIYARVSTDDQAEKGYSLPTQLDAMRDYAKAHGLQVVCELQDDYSGAKLNRPALDVLRGKLERKEAEAVIVYAADRLSRNLAHLLILREEFNRAGIELHYVNRGKAEDTAESRLTENIEGVIAEFEREKIKERTRRGKIAKAKAGKWVGSGRAPYPFRQVGKGKEARLEIDRAKAAVVERIVDMLLGRNGYERMSFKAIAKQLTAEGVPTAKPGARGWRTGVIYFLLTGKEILGIFERMGSVLEYPELAIIDRETYDQVQAVLEQNRRLSRCKRIYPYLFSGFARCTCGGGLCGRHVGKTYGYHYYICQRHAAQKHLVDCRERGSNVEIFEPLVWNWLVELLTNDAKLEKGIRAYMENRESELIKTRERRRLTEDMIRRADKQIELLTADLRELESQAGRAALRADIDRIGKEKDALLNTLGEIDAGLDQREIKDSDIETIRATARKIRAKLQGKPTYEEKRALFAAIDLQIELRHNESNPKERLLFVTCALVSEGESLALRGRLNSTANSSFYGGNSPSSRRWSTGSIS